MNQMFELNDHPIRTVKDRQGPLLFVAKDVCEALGYKNSRMALKHCNYVRKRDIVTPQGPAEVSCIEDQDVYRLLLGSTTPFAQEFKEWLCSEALPRFSRESNCTLGQEFPLHPLAM